MRKIFIFLTTLLLPLFISSCADLSSSKSFALFSSNETKLTITISGVGKGKVFANSGDFSCDRMKGSCTTTVQSGSLLTLTAKPDPGYLFLGWYGENCRGGLDCHLTIDQSKEIKAAFGMIAYLSNSNPFSDLNQYKNRPFSHFESNPVFNLWIATTDGKITYPVTQLTKANSQFPRWSPDATRLVYQSSRALDGSDQDIGKSNLWIINADGTENRALTQSIEVDSYLPQWSPDGEKIIYGSFKSLDGTDRKNEVSNLWIINADGSNPKPLTQLTKAGSYEPQWSPDGKQVVYESARALDGSDHSNQHYNIWISNSDGSNPRPLTKSTQADSYLPQWSPDGSKVAYQSFLPLDEKNEKNNFSNLWVINSDGSNNRPITQLTQAGSYSVQWSSDGNQIFYESSRALDGTDQSNGHYNIWTSNIDGSNPQPLTRLTEADNFIPQRSVDGNYLIYASSRSLDGSNSNNNHLSNIWIMNLENSENRALTQSQNAHSFLQLIAE